MKILGLLLALSLMLTTNVASATEKDSQSSRVAAERLYSVMKMDVQDRDTLRWRTRRSMHTSDPSGALYIETEQELNVAPMKGIFANAFAHELTEEEIQIGVRFFEIEGISEFTEELDRIAHEKYPDDVKRFIASWTEAHPGDAPVVKAFYLSEISSKFGKAFQAMEKEREAFINKEGLRAKAAAIKRLNTKTE